MIFNKKMLAKISARVVLWLAPVFAFFVGFPALADDGWSVVDKLDMSPFVPIVLDSFMTVATGVYEYFVGTGNGIVYLLIWGFLALSLLIYLVAMYVPKKWTDLFGLKTGGEMWQGTTTNAIIERVLKTALRAIVATTILLQIKPVYMTEWLVNPFLEVGSYYTTAITDADSIVSTVKAECPQSILSDGWVSERSCNFLIQPVHDLAKTNNKVIKRGFGYLADGFHGLVSPMFSGGQSFLDIITGISLIVAFVGCNIFMALLIIQGIFNFGMALILYPFHVLSWVAKDTKEYFDIWPAFSSIATALKQLLVTMIACAFILMINIAIVKSLFNWNPSTFMVAAGGSASSNVPALAVSATSFGEHSMVWLSAILTFFLMISIFNLTRKQLDMYAPNQSKLYDQVMGDAKLSWKKVTGMAESFKNIFKAVKKK